jgi:hypothetical protein
MRPRRTRDGARRCGPRRTRDGARRCGPRRMWTRHVGRTQGAAPCRMWAGSRVRLPAGCVPDTGCGSAPMFGWRRRVRGGAGCGGTGGWRQAVGDGGGRGWRRSGMAAVGDGGRRSRMATGGRGRRQAVGDGGSWSTGGGRRATGGGRRATGGRRARGAAMILSPKMVAFARGLGDQRGTRRDLRVTAMRAMVAWSAARSKWRSRSAPRTRMWRVPEMGARSDGSVRAISTR